MTHDERAGRGGRGHGGAGSGGDRHGGHGHDLPDRDERRVPYSFEEPLACPVGDDPEGFFDDPDHVKWTLRLLYSICGGLFVVDFFFHRHAVHPWEHWWGFYPIYGFVSCVLLVLAAKEMRKVVMRDRDYYDGDGAD